MNDLIKGFIYVKDPLSLFAFLALLLLVAFRTKQVPELFFKLMKRTVDKQSFERLLHRFMAYAFAAFVIVCGCAVTGQVLAHATGTRPYSTDEAKREIGSSTGSDAQKQAALKAYADALEQERSHKLDAAIQSLQSSIAQVPSLSAEYTLALLYQRKHDNASASKHIQEAARLAKPGDTLAQVRIQRLADNVRTDSEAPPQQDCQFVGGHKDPFPAGGTDFETASKISPRLYILNEDVTANRYFKIELQANQTLKITFRTPDFNSSAGATIYDAQGASRDGRGVSGASGMNAASWTPQTDGWAYFSVAKDTTHGSVYCVAVTD